MLTFLFLLLYGYVIRITRMWSGVREKAREWVARMRKEADALRGSWNPESGTLSHELRIFHFLPMRWAIKLLLIVQLDLYTSVLSEVRRKNQRS